MILKNNGHRQDNDAITTYEQICSEVAHTVPATSEDLSYLEFSLSHERN